MISAVLFNARKKHEDKLEQSLARTDQARMNRPIARREINGAFARPVDFLCQNWRDLYLSKVLFSHTSHIHISN